MRNPRRRPVWRFANGKGPDRRRDGKSGTGTVMLPPRFYGSAFGDVRPERRDCTRRPTIMTSCYRADATALRTPARDYTLLLGSRSSPRS